MNALLEVMKILIDNGSPIRIYHHPRDIILHPKINIVEILNEDGFVLESFDLIKKEVGWKENEDLDTSKIIVSLHVQ